MTRLAGAKNVMSGPAAASILVTVVLLPQAILLAMGDSHPPTITSFVIRFVVDEDLPHSAAERAPEAASYRGLIRHVQSDQTLNFHLWDEAVEFIRRFVPLESAIQE